MPTNNGDVGDALRALSLHLRKGLGIAPRPVSNATQAAILTAQSLCATAEAASAGLSPLQRTHGQAVGVTDVATPVLTP